MGIEGEMQVAQVPNVKHLVLGTIPEEAMPPAALKRNGIDAAYFITGGVA
jgi:hypothetical protein